MSENPFFILGCVRSGTTLLRNILRTHPDLLSPEETHIYRWGEPYGTDPFYNRMIRNLSLKEHRKIDNISEDEFRSMLDNSFSKKELTLKYMKLFSERKNMEGKRWFDKTPQNVYGLSLLSEDFPESKFVHLIRNPLNIVTSLKVGKVMKIQRMSGAISYWIEALQIVHSLKSRLGERYLEIDYGNLTSQPTETLTTISKFLNLDVSKLEFEMSNIHPEKNSYLEILSDNEIKTINHLTTPIKRMYNLKF